MIHSPFRLVSDAPRLVRRSRLRLELLDLEERVTPAAVSWDGGAGTFNWTDAANWSGNVLPGAGDDVTIDVAGSVANITLPAGTAAINSLTTAEKLTVTAGTLDVAQASTVAGLAFAGNGTVTGTGDLTVTGTFNWSGGVLRGAGKLILAPNSETTVSGASLPANLKVVGRTVENRGTASYSGDHLRFGISGAEPGAWLNKSGAIFTVLGGADIGYQSAQTGVITNEGTIVKPGPDETFLQGVRLDNTGTLDIQQGAFKLTFGGNLAGGAAVGAGALRVTAGATMSGDFTAANFGLLGGTVTVASGTPSVDSLAMVGGTTLDGPGDLMVSENFDYAGGFLRGAGKLILGAGSTSSINGFANPANLKVVGRVVENYGASTYDGYHLRIGYTNEEPGVWVNKPGATFTLAGDADIGYHSAQVGLFDNQGTLVKTGTQESFFNNGVRLVNTGTIDIRQGHLVLHYTDSSLAFDGTGRLVAAPGTDIYFHGPFGGTTTAADAFDSRGSVTLAGPNSAANPQLFEVMSQDRGASANALIRNFAFSQINFAGSYTRLTDLSDNAPGAAAEVLYVDTLYIPAGNTLDLNGSKVYARNPLITGTVVGGIITTLPDGGPLPLNTPTLGRIADAGETDEWTVFGRAGHSLLVRLNPGDGSADAPPAPALSRGRVVVLDSAGAVVADSAGAAGQVVAVTVPTLPADGTYRVVVSAPADQPGLTGGYRLGVYDTTIRTAPLVLNTGYTGNLATDYSVDRWTFTGRAGQNVRLNAGSSSPARVSFRLIGPGGVEVFSGQTDDSGPATLPADGPYTLEAVGLKGAYTFRLFLAPSQTIQLGVPLTSNYNPGSSNLFLGGDGRLFQFTNPTAGPLRIQLVISNPVGEVEIYLRRGAAPNRRDYDARGVQPSQDRYVDVPMAGAGTWYLLIYVPFVRQDSLASLLVTTAPVLLSAVSPANYATGQTATLTLTGAGFVPGTQADLIGGPLTKPATTVSVDAFDRLTATFDLTGVPSGSYSVRVRRPDAATDTLVNEFYVAPGGAANLETRLVLPNAFGRHATATAYVEYANTGTVAMPAPILVLQSADPDDSDRPLLTLDQSKVTQGFWTSSVPDGFAHSVQLYASGARPGVLLPGETVRVPVYYAGLQQPWDFSDTNVELEVRVHEAGNADPIDWPALKPTLKPATMDSGAWDAVFENLTAMVGPTWGDYVRRLGEMANALDRLGRTVTNVSELFAFQARLANGLPAAKTVACAVDAAVPGPGMAVTFGRSYGNTIAERYNVGPFGRGWAPGWDVYAETLADGTVIIHESADVQRRFQPDSRKAGAFFSQAGDTGTLKSTSGALELKDAGGSITRFLADGTLDYIQDVNGNRITAGYAGGKLATLTHSAGGTLTIAYNGAGRISSLTESTGRVTTFAYDGTNEHLLTATGPDGTITYAYDTGANSAKRHALTAVKDQTGLTTTFEYDAFGRLTASQLPGGVSRVTFAPDANGGVTITDAAGVTSSIAYDQRGLLARTADGAGDYVRYDYDAAGNVSKATDSLGRAVGSAWTAGRSLLSSTDPLGATTKFAPGGPNAQPLSFTDANGNLTKYQYDANGNLTATTYADGSVERAEYTPTGLPTEVTNRRGQAVTLAHNAAGQVTLQTYPDGSTVAYAYDAKARLATVTDAKGTTTFTYD